MDNIAIPGITDLDPSQVSELLNYLPKEQQVEFQQLLIGKDIVHWGETNFYIPEPRDPVTGNVLSLEGPIRIADYQARILREAFSTDESGAFNYATVIWSEVKKSGKTTVSAMAAMFMATNIRNAEVYLVANDGAQSQDKIYQKIATCIEIHGRLGGVYAHLNPYKGRVKMDRGSFIRAIAADPSGEAGGEPTFVAFSELHGFRQEHKQRLWCYDDQTEILTRRGWIKGIHLRNDDVIATVTPMTHLLEWERPKAILKEHYVGVMHLYKSRNFNQCVTPNHRLYGIFDKNWKHGDAIHHKGFLTSKELREHGGYHAYYPLITVNGYEYEEHGPVQIRASYNRKAFEIPWGDWCEYVGWYLSEGRVKFNEYANTRYPTAVFISQCPVAHPVEWERIKTLHDRILPFYKIRYNDTSFRSYSVPLAELVLSRCGSGTRDKKIPDEIKNTDPDSLCRFLDGFIGGDGYINKSGSVELSVGNKALALDLQEVAFRLGYRTSMKQQFPTNREWHPYWRLYLTPPQDGYNHELNEYRGHWDEMDYDGLVWCPSTTNGLIVVRRNGKTYVGGNSEMTIPPTKFGRSMRWAESYAGYAGEDSVLEQLYNENVKEEFRHPDFPDLPVYRNKEAKTLAFWSHVGLMPWHTDEYYAQEQANLLPHEFRRMHRNEWVGSESSFVDNLWWDNCCGDVPFLNATTPIIVALDAAVSGDCFALIAVSRHPDPERDSDTVMIRYRAVWYPPEGGKIDYTGSEIEPGPEMVLRRLCSLYNVVQVCYDPYQLHDMATRLQREGLAWFSEFSQSGERLVADTRLQKLIIQQRIVHDNDPELNTHVSNSAAKLDSSEDRKLRIVKKSRGKPIDLVVALSMASHRCLELNLA